MDLLSEEDRDVLARIAALNAGRPKVQETVAKGRLYIMSFDCLTKLSNGQQKTVEERQTLIDVRKTLWLPNCGVPGRAAVPIQPLPYVKARSCWKGSATVEIDLTPVENDLSGDCNLIHLLVPLSSLNRSTRSSSLIRPTYHHTMPIRVKGTLVGGTRSPRPDSG